TTTAKPRGDRGYRSMLSKILHQHNVAGVLFEQRAKNPSPVRRNAQTWMAICNRWPLKRNNLGHLSRGKTEQFDRRAPRPVRRNKVDISIRHRPIAGIDSPIEKQGFLTVLQRDSPKVSRARPGLVLVQLRIVNKTTVGCLNCFEPTILGHPDSSA